jgi:hypothetical protein
MLLALKMLVFIYYWNWNLSRFATAFVENVTNWNLYVLLHIVMTLYQILWRSVSLFKNWKGRHTQTGIVIS